MSLLSKKSKEILAPETELNPDIKPLGRTPDIEVDRETLSSPETSKESGESPLSKNENQEEKSPAAAAARQPGPVQVDKSQQLANIEDILEDNLQEAYGKMDTQHQQMFKRAGEETARQIDGLMSQAKVKVQQIFELIKSWLMTIPGINKWFVIQESKIKTDRLMRLKDKKP